MWYDERTNEQTNKRTNELSVHIPYHYESMRSYEYEEEFHLRSSTAVAAAAAAATVSAQPTRAQRSQGNTVVSETPIEAHPPPPLAPA